MVSEAKHLSGIGHFMIETARSPDRKEEAANA
jgi:hypothetical protein